MIYIHFLKQVSAFVKLPCSIAYMGKIITLVYGKLGKIHTLVYGKITEKGPYSMAKSRKKDPTLWQNHGKMTLFARA